MSDSSSAVPSDQSVNGPRFQFGENWQKFRTQLNPARLEQAEASLKQFWPTEELPVRFLDVGSGSGLFSLAARKLGATVHSFDYDPNSVACTQALKEEFFPEDEYWQVEQGSALDREYLRSLGHFDIVYSWGVLHHTGAMWQALENVLIPLKPGGLLVVAIYNHQGIVSWLWKLVKMVYCSGVWGRWMMTLLFVPGFMLAFFLNDLVKGRHPLARYRSDYDQRGMSVVTDIIDWIGGYPYEMATPGQLISFYSQHGLVLQQEKITRGLGCNEFVFQQAAIPASEARNQTEDPAADCSLNSLKRQQPS